MWMISFILASIWLTCLGQKNITTSTVPPRDYEFTYAVNHEEDIKQHMERRRDGAVEGSYEVIEPDGFKRIVKYTADDKKGFSVVVRREQIPDYVKKFVVNKSSHPIKNPVQKTEAPTGFKVPSIKLQEPLPFTFPTHASSTTPKYSPLSSRVAPEEINFLQLPTNTRSTGRVLPSSTPRSSRGRILRPSSRG